MYRVLQIIFLMCSYASEWEGSLVAIYREFGDTWNPIPGSKIHDKESQLYRKHQTYTSIETPNLSLTHQT